METPERLSALARNLKSETGRSGADEVERLHTKLYHYDVPGGADAWNGSSDDDQDTVELTETGRAFAAGLEQ